VVVGQFGSLVRIDYRVALGKVDNARKYAAELVALAPDVILASGSVSTGALFEATSTVLIVFAHVPDPVGAGFVESLTRPGGNVTGFSPFEYALSGKWLELLREMVPHVNRVAFLFNPATAPYFEYLSLSETLLSPSQGRPSPHPFMTELNSNPSLPRGLSRQIVV